MMERWIREAEALGFLAAPVKIDTLRPMAMVREACAADKCGAYGRNWTCPPACGSLEDCGARMASFRSGILLQTVGKLQKRIDTKAYRETEQNHLQRFSEFCRILRQSYPDALCLGAGGCRVCGQCAYPEPCRFPEQAMSSMEGYGLFVTQVCRDNGLPYYDGPGTITYTACVLFDRHP